MKTAEIRQSFIDFFKRHDHKELPSSPVIPYDDPTLLFTNAGMNQFKDVFTGKRKVEYKRATTAQKCIRAGGKHNDLDNVGFTARHQTFFEMMGNFSFGDYFKEEAIKFAWDWITKEVKLPVDKLYASVYETDDDAFALWEKIAPELKNGRILRFGKKDNYWSMGDIGPNGPCSEIHFDRGEKYGAGPEDKVNGETERFVEFWNLVFMQFETHPDGSVTELPNPSVDTGAGLERMTTIINGLESNYGIDIFQTLIKATEEITKSTYNGDLIPSFHVIADHLRALTFAIADGAGISNEGQGYVLRRILRRAARHGRLLGAHEPFIYQLVPTLVNEMGQAYPEIKEKQSHIVHVLKAEEESFGRTLETGLDLFDKITSSMNGTVINGDDVFKLYDTYGFPYDLTELMAQEKGLRLDKEGFDKAMNARQEQSRAGGKFEAVANTLMKDLEAANLDWAPTEFIRDSLQTSSLLLKVLPVDEDKNEIAVMLDKTPFYVEAGGQISDTGLITGPSFQIEVTGMTGYREYTVHIGTIKNGQLQDIVQYASNRSPVTAQVNAERRWSIMRNHTVTHLTHKALRDVLGSHIKQSGSYVGPDRMRFDFSHHQPMSDEEIAKVEKIVNEEILKGTPVVTDVMDLEEAKKSGAMALFGEKYDEKVRVVSVPGFSQELCGGTHVENISQIGPFFITLETGIASGVRRLEAITGEEAIKYMLEAKAFRSEVAHLVNRPETESLAGVQQLKEQNSSLQKELKKVKTEMFSGSGSSVGEEKTIGDIKLFTHDFGETDRDVMASWLDSKKDMNEPVLAIALGIVNEKLTYMSSASSSAIKSYKLTAGNLTKELLPHFGGRGGGKPNFAQGSVADGTDVTELFAKAEELIQGQL